MKASEKLIVYGSTKLSDLEILETIVGHQGGARGLWDRCEHDISKLNSMIVKEIMTVDGIGEVTARKIYAAAELGKRLVSSGGKESKTNISTPSAIVQFLRAHFQGAQQESLMVVGLDARQRVTVVRTVGVGSLAQVDVHPREFFRPLIREGAHCCIMAHNHPSGDCEPSMADFELTKRMCEVGRLVGIPLLDHIVFSDNDSCSIATLGMME